MNRTKSIKNKSITQKQSSTNSTIDLENRVQEMDEKIKKIMNSYKKLKIINNSKDDQIIKLRGQNQQLRAVIKSIQFQKSRMIQTMFTQQQKQKQFQNQQITHNKNFQSSYLQQKQLQKQNNLQQMRRMYEQNTNFQVKNGKYAQNYYHKKGSQKQYPQQKITQNKTELQHYHSYDVLPKIDKNIHLMDQNPNKISQNSYGALLLRNSRSSHNLQAKYTESNNNNAQLYDTEKHEELSAKYRNHKSNFPRINIDSSLADVHNNENKYSNKQAISNQISSDDEISTRIIQRVSNRQYGKIADDKTNKTSAEQNKMINSTKHFNRSTIPNKSMLTNIPKNKNLKATNNGPTNTYKIADKSMHINKNKGVNTNNNKQAYQASMLRQLWNQRDRQIQRMDDIFDNLNRRLENTQ